MDPDEDVLFLYLTSHGSKDHRLSADFWPLDLRDVDPAMLKRMLDKAGIRRRVIRIRKRHSGRPALSSRSRTSEPLLLPPRMPQSLRMQQRI